MHLHGKRVGPAKVRVASSHASEIAHDDKDAYRGQPPRTMAPPHTNTLRVARLPYGACDSRFEGFASSMLRKIERQITVIDCMTHQGVISPKLARAGFPKDIRVLSNSRCPTVHWCVGCSSAFPCCWTSRPFAFPFAWKISARWESPLYETTPPAVTRLSFTRYKDAESTLQGPIVSRFPSVPSLLSIPDI